MALVLVEQDVLPHPRLDVPLVVPHHGRHLVRGRVKARGRASASARARARVRGRVRGRARARRGIAVTLSLAVPAALTT